MISQALKDNIKHMKETVREIYIFTNQLEVIKNLELNTNSTVNTKEKKLLSDAISALTNQLRILNSTIPVLTEGVKLYKKFEGDNESLIDTEKIQPKLVQLKYKPIEKDEGVSLTLNDKDKKEFLDNLSMSNLSINQLKRNFSPKTEVSGFGKPNEYAKISNRFFRDIANKLVSKGYFENLNRDLRKMNSPFVTSTYVSMMFFTAFLSLFFGIAVLIILLFYNLSFVLPFITPAEESVAIRFAKYFMIIFVFPLVSLILMYIYPSTESKNLGHKIDQELPFVTIHMSAIASSGIDPTSIFKIILQSQEYEYTKLELRKLMNLVNFHGKDIVSALKVSARSCASSKLRELLDGLATAITSGGSLSQFLDKHADSLLFDYRMERERYTKTSETFMDIYISIVIAAPMILLMLFVIMGSTGSLSNFLGLPTDVLSMLLILIIVMLNVGFLVFLRIQQPPI